MKLFFVLNELYMVLQRTGSLNTTVMSKEPNWVCMKEKDIFSSYKVYSWELDLITFMCGNYYADWSRPEYYLNLKDASMLCSSCIQLPSQTCSAKVDVVVATPMIKLTLDTMLPICTFVYLKLLDANVFHGISLPGGPHWHTLRQVFHIIALIFSM